MSFEIEGKVALVTGGASGIGLQIVKELLRNGLRGITIGDINKDLGSKVLEEIENEFGQNKAIFVEMDVTNANSFEDTFKKCIAQFNNIDILINNAGIINNKQWEKMIAVNFNGVAQGTILALENYIPKYKTDKNGEGVIVNIASIAGVCPITFIPMYSASKFGVVGMSLTFGDAEHYERTKVRVVAMCPGMTTTTIARESKKSNFEPYQELVKKNYKKYPFQKVEFVAESVIKIIKHAKTGTAWVAEDHKGPYEFIMPERHTFLSNTI